MTNRRSLLLAGVVVSCLAGLAPARAETATELSLGSPDAPVTMIEYASLTCPHCASFHNQTLPELKVKYIDTGKVRLVYRDFPLDQTAFQASIIARCAGPERAMTFIQAFFGSQEQWAHTQDPPGSLRQLGKLGGLTDARMDACFADKELSDSVLQMRLDGEKDGVQSTPSFLINGEMHAGDQGIEGFTEILDPLVR